MHQLWQDEWLRKRFIKIARSYGKREAETVPELLNIALGLFYESVKSGRFQQRNEKSVRDFIVGIANWNAFTRYRSGQRRDKTKTEWKAMTEYELENPEAYLLSAERRASYIKVLDEFIGERCRKVILLKEEGFSETESAKELNLTLSSLKDARKTCKKKWNDMVEYLRNNPEVRKTILGR